MSKRSTGFTGRSWQQRGGVCACRTKAVGGNRVTGPPWCLANAAVEVRAHARLRLRRAYHVAWLIPSAFHGCVLVRDLIRIWHGAVSS